VLRSWFWDTKLLWADCYRLPCNMTTPPLVRVLYCVEMGYYLQVTLISPCLLATPGRKCMHCSTMVVAPVVVHAPMLSPLMVK